MGKQAFASDRAGIMWAHKSAPHRCSDRGHDTEGVTSMPDQCSKTCEQCQIPIERMPWHYRNSWEKTRFCSRKCFADFRRGVIRVPLKLCAGCGKQVGRQIKGDLCAECRVRTLKERLTDKVDKTGSCWIWTGSKSAAGYGQINRRGRSELAHRMSYEIHVGPVPEGLHLDHLCRNRDCVNPDHLEPVTPAENTRRGLAGEMKTHCANGHPWTDENKMVNGRQSNGKFAHCCKVCHRERERARRIRNGS